MKTSFAALPALGLIPSLNVDLAVTAKTNQPIWSSLARCGLPLIFLLLGGPLQAASIIQFSATTYNVTEGMNQVEIAVQRTNDLDTVVSVDLATSNLTATAGADYLDVSARLTFLAGETNQIVAVPILNDGLVEGIETFQVLLSNPTGGAELSTRSNATVRITDNDKGLQLEFAKYQVCEDEGSVLIGVLRGDDSSFPVTVEYATADGTALAGQDYTATSGKLEFAASERLKLIRVPILNDWLKEVDETFRLYQCHGDRVGESDLGDDYDRGQRLGRAIRVQHLLGSRERGYVDREGAARQRCRVRGLHRGLRDDEPDGDRRGRLHGDQRHDRVYRRRDDEAAHNPDHL
jgi:hypothetical protein